MLIVIPKESNKNLTSEPQIDAEENLRDMQTIELMSANVTIVTEPAKNTKTTTSGWNGKTCLANARAVQNTAQSYKTREEQLRPRRTLEANKHKSATNPDQQLLFHTVGVRTTGNAAVPSAEEGRDLGQDRARSEKSGSRTSAALITREERAVGGEKTGTFATH
ncbi:hypothetical protein Y032_0365g3581 [Ancylostoma ceylanicum]|uniref:Uncharacterized protein n=1 Tax=Ancylostoma ceylanicum TaxID=53326 RepID=A0A016RUV8_9BILA|nr:hypothetical protein Y032_0365g3581 [Ancylostoma ceylanicum]